MLERKVSVLEISVPKPQTKHNVSLCILLIWFTALWSKPSFCDLNENCNKKIYRFTKQKCIVTYFELCFCLNEERDYACVKTEGLICFIFLFGLF